MKRNDKLICSNKNNYNSLQIGINIINNFILRFYPYLFSISDVRPMNYDTHNVDLLFKDIIVCFHNDVMKTSCTPSHKTNYKSQQKLLVVECGNNVYREQNRLHQIKLNEESTPL